MIQMTSKMEMHNATSSYIPLLEQIEQSLERRFAKSKPFSEKTLFEFTSDAGFCHQYYNLREEDFFSPWRSAAFTSSQDEFDASSHVMVARRGRLCVAGGRLNISTPAAPAELPLEAETLALQSLLPELDLHETNYAEISRLAIMPDYEANVLPELFSHMLKEAIARNVEYVFMLSSALQAASYANVAKLMQLKSNQRQVLLTEEEPTESNTKMLSIIDLSMHVRKLKATFTPSKTLADQ